MSNYLSIAAVTMTLRDILQEAASAAVPGTLVTTHRPEKASDGGQDKAGVNIFLYQALPNAAWRNSEIAVRYRDDKEPNNRGRDRVAYRRQVPLNLHYLLSFYGGEVRLEPQRLLGSAVSALNARTRLDAAHIRQAIDANDYLKLDGYPDDSYLDFQVERIERVSLTPIALNLEELSKLWSVFFQVPYTLSIAYEASVVLVDAGLPGTSKVVVEPKVNVGQAGRTVKVPDVSGLTVEAARARLWDSGFVAGQPLDQDGAAVDAVNTDPVTGSSPTAGLEVAWGSTVSPVVAGRPKVPGS